ncbi:MAG: tetratricopeptide repeat protein [Acidimicrobiales bacterium]
MPGARARTETFLFSDIEGSTRLLRRLGYDYGDVLEAHRRMLRSAFAAHGGEEQSTAGDSFFVVFPIASEAIAAAVDAQLALVAYAAGAIDSVRVRMGIHSGEALLAFGDYIGLAVHEAARIVAVGHGGQILVSEVTRRLAEEMSAPLSFRDVGDHRLKDFDQPLRLYQVCHPDLPADFPSLRTLAMTPNNLPRALTSFVGREREMVTAAELVRGNRFVTLTGPGGIGKTRLATELAATLSVDYSAGVWLAELAHVDAPDRVPGTVAAAAGLHEEAGVTPTAALVDWIGGRRLLLLLDNCEQVLSACAALVTQLLAVCPELTVLATSREPLAAVGETVWRVPPLSTPSAADLFVDRARAVRSGFEVTDADTPVLIDICSQLDGIPLAVELAAARASALSLARLASRLDDRFRLLSGVRHGGAARHRTLHAVVDWSFDLLTEPERVLFRRLSALSGWFTLEAAEEVGAGKGLAKDDVVDVLTQLVDRSLVMFEDGRLESRYRMLETIREYAAEKLAEANEEQSTGEGLLEWCVRLAEEGSAQLQGPEQSRWLGVLAANHDSVRAALAWGLASEANGAVGRLAAAMGRFWLVRGHWNEGRTWLERALAEPAEPAVRMRLLVRAAALAVVQGDEEVSRAMGNEALALAEEVREPETEAAAYFALGVDAWSRRDFAATQASFDHALALSRAVDDVHGTAAALAGLGSLAWANGQMDTARRLLEESLTIRRRVGDDHGIAVSLNNLAAVAQAEGDLDGVRTLAAESLRISRALEDTEGIAAALHHLAEVTEAQGDLEAATALAQESLTLGRQLGDRRGAASAEETLGRLARASGDQSAALAFFDRSLTAHAELSDVSAVVGVLITIAELALDARRPDVATRLASAIRTASVVDATNTERLDAVVDRGRSDFVDLGDLDLPAGLDGAVAVAHAWITETR